MRLPGFLKLKRQQAELAIASAPSPEFMSTQFGPRHTYDQDGLRSVHNHEFMDDPIFQAAYRRGILAAGGRDYNWHWRVHVGLWAARTASGLTGDFVECGVGRGFMSSAIMHHLDWNRLERHYYLLDTFADPDSHDSAFAARNSHVYANSFDEVRLNFSEWPTARIVVGAVPETLPEITSQSIAFLHLDMNSRLPEVSALAHLWERMTPGGLVLFDDYAYRGYRDQKLGIDELAVELGGSVLSLPTGQGLLIKPVAG